MSENPDTPSFGDDLTEAVPGGLLDIPKRIIGQAGKAMLKEAPKVTRFVLKKIPGVPGFVADVADFATAKDKWRAGLGLAGGVLGGVAGEALDPLGGGVAGGMAGEAGAKWVYDHHAELQQKAAATAQWMKDRAAQVAGSAAQGVANSLPTFAPTFP
jgi:hypothetical protein